MDQIRKEVFYKQVSDVLGEPLADRLYVAVDYGHVDDFDEEFFGNLADACTKFQMRRASRERRAEKCL